MVRRSKDEKTMQPVIYKTWNEWVTDLLGIRESCLFNMYNAVYILHDIIHVRL